MKINVRVSATLIIAAIAVIPVVVADAGIVGRVMRVMYA